MFSVEDGMFHTLHSPNSLTFPASGFISTPSHGNRLLTINGDFTPESGCSSVCDWGSPSSAPQTLEDGGPSVHSAPWTQLDPVEKREPGDGLSDP